MQMVEIAKAISNNAEIIIMDEPTSAISGKEVQVLFNIIRDLTSQHCGYLYSHKMDEIGGYHYCNARREIYRHSPAKELTTERLINLIVGRS